MSLLHHILGGIVLVLAMVGTVCCGGAVIGVWVLRADVARRVEAIDAYAQF